MAEYKVGIAKRGLLVQKDQYRILAKDGSEVSVDALQFEASSSKEAAVQWFKRLKTRVEIEGEGKTSYADVVLDMRSHHAEFFTPTANGGQDPLPVTTIGTLVAGAVARFSHEHLPIRRVLHQTPRKAFVLAIHNPVWWAGALHKLDDYGPVPLRFPLDEKENNRLNAGKVVSLPPFR